MSQNSQTHFQNLAANAAKNELWYRFFPVNFAKFLRTPFLQNASGRLLLNSVMLT